MVWHWLFSKAIGPPAPLFSNRLDKYPSITVIRPVRGKDPGQYENFRAALDNGYPGDVETIFIFDEWSDPGLPVAEAAIQAHIASGMAGRARVEVVSLPPRNRTGKLNAMIIGAQMARGELLAFSDSDTRPDREVLRVLVETLVAGRPDIGCTFAPVAVQFVDSPTAGDVGYATMLNSLYGPGAAYTAYRNGAKMPFIMGQLMVFSREALYAIGGLECAEGQLVDDMYIGRRLVKAGYANIIVNYTLPIIAGGLSFGHFLKVYRRWLLFARNGLEFSFVWPMLWRWIAFYAAIGVLVAAAALSAPWGALAALAALIGQDWSAETLQRRLGGTATPFRYRWIFFALLILAPAILASMVRSGVDWRGREYRLGAKAKLELAHNRPAEIFSRWSEAVGARIRRL